MAFLINGKQERERVCKTTTESVPKILLSARATSQHRTQDSQFFWIKSILFFYKATIMKGGRSSRATQAQSTKEKGGEFGETHKRDNVCQEVLEAVGGKYLPWKGFSKSQGSFMLVKTGLVHHCGGKCSLGKFSSHFSQQISAVPAIPCLSRNTKACER